MGTAARPRPKSQIPVSVPAGAPALPAAAQVSGAAVRRRDAEPAGWVFRPGHTSPEPPPPAARLKREHAGAPGSGRRGRVSLQQQVRPAGPPPSFRAPSGTALATFPAGRTGTTATLGRKPQWIFQRRRRRRDTHRVGIVAVLGG